jgi:hypothetical protein
MAARKPEDFPSESLRYGALETSELVTVYTLHLEGYKFQRTANIGGVAIFLNWRQSISCPRLRGPRIREFRATVLGSRAIFFGAAQFKQATREFVSP